MVVSLAPENKSLLLNGLHTLEPTKVNTENGSSISAKKVILRPLPKLGNLGLKKSRQSCYGGAVAPINVWSKRWFDRWLGRINSQPRNKLRFLLVRRVLVRDRLVQILPLVRGVIHRHLMTRRRTPLGHSHEPSLLKWLQRLTVREIAVVEIISIDFVAIFLGEKRQILLVQSSKHAMIHFALRSVSGLMKILTDSSLIRAIQTTVLRM
jgi:hypothetical protein